MDPLLADAHTSGSRRRIRSPGPLVVAALVVAITAVIFVVVAPDRGAAPTGATGAPTAAPSPTGVGTPSPSPEPRPTDAGPLASLTVHDGDAVTATGQVVQEHGASPTLCEPLPITAGPASVHTQSFRPSCSPLGVTLDLDVEWLPGWQAQDGGGFTAGALTMEGVWRDGTLVVGSTVEAPPGDELGETWQVPCAPPAGGWSDGNGVPADVDLGTVEMAVDAEVAAHPDVYHAFWIAYPDGDPREPGAPVNEFGEPAHQVMVVSTVDEPTELQDHLASVYPGNLCVTQIEHSSAELDAVAQRLSTAYGSWVADAQSLYAAVDNRVILDLPVLDDAAVARIGEDAALLEVRALVRPSA